MWKRPFQRRKPIIVSLDWTRPKDPPLSLGHASIVANMLHQNVDHIQRSWAVNHNQFEVGDVVDFVMTNSRTGNEDFAVGAFVWNEKYVLDIITKLRHYKFGGNIIVGGPQISYVKSNPELERLYDADVFIRGTAEEALVNLYRTDPTSSDMTPAAIRGVHYRGISDDAKPASASLSSIPSPLLSGLISPKGGFIRWETQRGCAFSCSFCQHKEPNKEIVKHNRYLPMNRVAEEINWINSHPEIKDIAVLDPVFNSGPNYLDVLRQLRLGGYKGRISLQCKADMVNENFLAELTEFKTAGGTPVLEFGVQTIIKTEQKVINRLNNLTKIAHVVQECSKREIEHEVSLIFGLPTQTLDSFKTSVQLVLDWNVPTIHAFPLMLLRGTDLFDQKAKYGLVESNELASDAIDRVQVDIPHVVSSHSFSYDDWKQMCSIASQLEGRNKTRKPLHMFEPVSPAVSSSPKSEQLSGPKQ